MRPATVIEAGDLCFWNGVYYETGEVRPPQAGEHWRAFMGKEVKTGPGPNNARILRPLHYDTRLVLLEPEDD